MRYGHFFAKIARKRESLLLTPILQNSKEKTRSLIQTQGKALWEVAGIVRFCQGERLSPDSVSEAMTAAQLMISDGLVAQTSARLQFGCRFDLSGGHAPSTASNTSSTGLPHG